MKRAVFATIVCIISMSVAAFGQRQKLSFNDNNGVPNSGTYGPNDTFSIDVAVKFSGYNALGQDFWFEVQNALAPNISITNVTYFTFLDPIQTGPNPAPFNLAPGADTGYMTEARDLGGIAQDVSMSVPPGFYIVASVQLTLTGAAPGTYRLKATTLSPKNSGIADDTFVFHNLTASPTYRLTIIGTDMAVPEPTTLSLLSFAAAGLGLAAFRRRHAVS